MASNNPDLSDNIVHDNDLHDNELRSRFAELRREEEAQVPAFALPRPNGMRHGSRLQPRLGRIAAVALCLAGIIAGVLFLQLLRPHVDRSPGKAPVSLNLGTGRPVAWKTNDPGWPTKNGVRLALVMVGAVGGASKAPMSMRPS